MLIHLVQPNSVAVPYCQQAPKNSELNGLFQCQYQGADQKNFVGGVAVGGAGTIPFGKSAPLDPLGSCLANPDGPIADGSQLTDITSDPGVKGGSAGSSDTGPNTKTAAGETTTSASTAEATTAVATTDEATATATTVAETIVAPAATSAASSSGSSFQLQNAKDAQALNAKFATMTADSSCNG